MKIETSAGEVELTAEMVVRGMVFQNTGYEDERAGGKARAKALSPERRSEIARTAARARWAPNGGRNMDRNECLPDKHRAPLAEGSAPSGKSD